RMDWANRLVWRTNAFTVPVFAMRTHRLPFAITASSATLAGPLFAWQIASACATYSARVAAAWADGVPIAATASRPTMQAPLSFISLSFIHAPRPPAEAGPKSRVRGVSPLPAESLDEAVERRPLTLDLRPSALEGFGGSRLPGEQLGEGPGV